MEHGSLYFPIPTFPLSILRDRATYLRMYDMLLLSSPYSVTVWGRVSIPQTASGVRNLRLSLTPETAGGVLGKSSTINFQILAHATNY